MSEPEASTSTTTSETPPPPVLTFGMAVKDVHTYFSGVLTAKAEYIDGEVRYQIERVNRDGNLQVEWFNAKRVVLGP